MEKPIRVLQVFGIMNRGGAESMIMSLYRAIDRTEIQFDFVVHTGKTGAFDAEIEELGGKLFHAPAYTGKNHLSYVKWWKTFFGSHPEYHVVHSHIRSTASLILSIAKKHGLATIAHSHSTSNGRGIKSMVKHVFQRSITSSADVCLACSKEAGEWLFAKREFTVFNNAIDTEKFVFCPKARAEVRQEFGISENCFAVGTVGRLMKPKNPHGMIDIWKAVAAKDPDARFLWVGDGELRAEIEARLRQENLTDSVLMIGVRPDVERFYSAMDAFLFPSLWEGLGIVAVEAQTAGLHSVVSDAVPALADIGAGLFHRVALSAPAEEWADRLLSFKGADRLPDAAQFTKQAGYDIKETSQMLQNLYCSCYDKWMRQ